MKVIIAIPCLLRGGTEMQTLALARALSSWAEKLTVCCYFEHDPSVVGEFEESGIEVRLLRLSRCTKPWRLICALQSVFRSLRPDIVHVQYMAPGLLPVIAARCARVPRVIATVHYPYDGDNPKARWLLRTAALLSDRFLCVSEAVERSWFVRSSLLQPGIKARAVSWGVNHCSIHNSVDLERLDALLATRIADANNLRNRASVQANGSLGFVIGAVARLRREKGLDLLLEAFALAHRKIPSARLLIVGDGPDRDQLAGQSKRLGIGRKVTWAGSQLWDNAILLMSEMDIVVVPSRSEGFGLSAAEAMACRRPVIAADVDGLAEVIGHAGAGILVAPNDPLALANAIAMLKEQPKTRSSMAVMGRQRVEERFSFKFHSCQIRSLYEGIRR